MFKWFKRNSARAAPASWRESGHRHRRHSRLDAGPSSLHPLPEPSDSERAVFAETEPQGAADLPWREILGKTGAEVAQSLVHSLHELDAAADGTALPAFQLESAREAIEHARRVAMVAQNLARPRDRNSPPSDRINLEEVVQAAFEARAGWLERCGVAVSFTPGRAIVWTDAAQLYALVDELIQWAVRLAPDVDFSIGTLKDGSPRLQVLARVDVQALDAGNWETLGWYFFHQQLRLLGGQASFHADPDKLIVTAIFPPHAADEPDTCSAELTHDHDVAIDVLAGRRIIVISPDAALRREVRDAMPRFFDLRPYESVEDARRDFVYESPHAVIYDGSIDAAAVFMLRHDRHGDRDIAYVEVCSEADDFSVSQFGSMSTGHVGRAVLPNALVPALVFELCKADAGQ